MFFISPTRGRMTLEETFADIIAYIEEQPDEQYKFIVGTDSQPHCGVETNFVTAVIIHRVGKGGRFFYRRAQQRYLQSLRQRIFYETSLSLEVAGQFSSLLSENGAAGLNVEIHMDVGARGDTRELIREMVGMVAGSGYCALIKPDSFGASKVADKFTK